MKSYGINRAQIIPWLIAFIPATMGSVALAESVSFKTTSLESGYVSGVGAITIAPTKGGKLSVLHNKNLCSPEGTCTEVAYTPKVVEVRVIHDNRPADGDLLLKLTPEISLAVGSGFNRDRSVTYTAVIQSKNGEVRVPLTPHVSLTLSK